MDQGLVAKYELRLPRYTSYPTAPHFSPAVTGGDYGRWLGELPPDTALSLYLHIAYCAELCWFCGCHTKITKRYAPVQDYLEVLLEEVDLVAARLSDRRPVRHVHFGGGSPTILSPADFSRAIAHLRERFSWTETVEVAVELDPRTTRQDFVETMAASGVNRVSLGIQDFDPVVQQAIHRVQPREMSEQVVGWLRQYGIFEINLDLVYGLPYQTEAGLGSTVEQAVSLRPSRVSLFGYAHVPWMKKHQRLIPEKALPDTETRWRQYEMATARLQELGYVAIGLDHFALPEDGLTVAQRERRLHRNFQGYTTDAAGVLLGLGASGIGSLPQGYVANEGDIEAYKRLIRSGQLAVRRGIAVSDDDRLRRAIIERLMCDLAVDVAEIAGSHGVSMDSFDTEMNAMAGLEQDGILRRDGNRIVVTDEGRPLVRAVCAVFDRYLKRGEARHSQAV
ncbi:MAG: oxygen-independent coproporphyrinogen III oxidase [Alphaproteobacteria bacterium]